MEKINEEEFRKYLKRRGKRPAVGQYVTIWNYINARKHWFRLFNYRLWIILSILVTSLEVRVWEKE